MLTKKRQQQIQKWKERDVSWSQISSWSYSKDQWALKYLFDRPEEPNQAMIFGNTIGDTLGTTFSAVPKLDPYLKGEKEFKLRVKMNDYSLIGFCDHYCPIEKVLNENKTSQNGTRWTQKTVDEHGQITMYALMLYLQEKVKPEDLKIFLNFIPVKHGNDFQLTVDPDVFHIFETKRTLKQCLMFGSTIGKTLKEMESYAQVAVEPPLA